MGKDCAVRVLRLRMDYGFIGFGYDEDCLKKYGESPKKEVQKSPKESEKV